MAAKDIKFSTDARDKMLRGVEILNDAVKVTLVLIFTPVALGIFAYNGRVDWTAGIALAVGAFLGALLGVRLQVLKGQKWVRGVVTTMVVLFAIRLLVAG